jgi:predicted MFS family arabinose efflux permease
MTPKRMWAIVGLFALAYWGTSTDPIYPTLLLEFLSGEFGVGKAAASLPIVMACLGGAIGAIGSGLLAQRIGVGRWVFIGLWGFAACSVLNALDTPLWLFDVTRFFTGIFQGILSLQFLLAIGALVPEERRGTAIGVISAGMLFAVAAGPLLIRATQPPESPWHMPFWFFGAAVLIAALGLHALRLPARPEGAGESVSAWALLRDTQTLMLMALGGVLLASIVAMGANFTIFAKQQFGWELHQLLPQMITLGVGGIVGALVGGKLSDRIGPRAILIWSSLLVAIFFVIVPPLTSTPWAVYPVFFIMSALAAARVPPYQALMLSFIPPKAQGPILALRNTISYLGTAIGAGVGAFLYQLTDSYMSVAIFAGVVGLFALWIAVRWVPKR